MKQVKKIDFNYRKLLGKIKEKYNTQENFSTALGVGRVSLSQKLNNKLEFKQSEIVKACKLLDISLKDAPDYFLTVK